MKQQISLSIFLLLLLVSISYAAVVDTEIMQELYQNDTVSVIVVLKEDSKTASVDLKERKDAITEKQDDVLEDLNLEDHKSFFGINNKEQDFELERKYETTNAFAGEVNEKGLD
ncbi:hypothetical protein HQ489_01590, partial [Candidatus Woesearchaeota archaeon]|nr:hypothetical protein [Candidatus Woesearchaeota archaeon]